MAVDLFTKGHQRVPDWWGSVASLDLRLLLALAGAFNASILYIPFGGDLGHLFGANFG